MDKFRGLNGTIVLKEDCVQILREKALDSTFHEQEKIEIPYSEIKDIYFAEGSLINGYLSILRVGASKPTGILKAVKDKPTGILKAVKDDTSVVFRMFKNGEAERFAEEIRKRI